MPTVLEKEWAAVEGEEIVLKADSKGEVITKLRQKGLDKDDYEIIALPKSHNSMFV